MKRLHQTLVVYIFLWPEKGLECDRVAVDIRAAENLSEDYLAKNPGGRVPLLELEDGTCIGESVAICRYMDSLQPQPSLFGTDGVEAAKVEMWQRRAEMGFHAGSGRRVPQHYRFFQRP
jgi:glutathione S-transferase